MKKKKSFGSFSEEYEYRKLRRQLRVTNLAVDILCVVLICSFGLNAVCSVGAREILSIVGLAVFSLILIANVAFPLAVIRALEHAQTFTNKVGKFILAAVLIPLYPFVWLAGLIGSIRGRRSAKRDKTRGPSETYFRDDSDNVFSPGSSGMLSHISRIFAAFSEKGQYVFFPLIIVLLIIGLIFFFISSSSVFGFIYTLF